MANYSSMNVLLYFLHYGENFYSSVIMHHWHFIFQIKLTLVFFSCRGIDGDASEADISDRDLNSLYVFTSDKKSLRRKRTSSTSSCGSTSSTYSRRGKHEGLDRTPVYSTRL